MSKDGTHGFSGMQQESFKSHSPICANASRCRKSHNADLPCMEYSCVETRIMRTASCTTLHVFCWNGWVWSMLGNQLFLGPLLQFDHLPPKTDTLCSARCTPGPEEGSVLGIQPQATLWIHPIVIAQHDMHARQLHMANAVQSGR